MEDLIVRGAEQRYQCGALFEEATITRSTVTRTLAVAVAASNPSTFLIMVALGVILHIGILWSPEWFGVVRSRDHRADGRLSPRGGGSVTTT
ncbi:hypothetical protein ACWEGQ_01595 [Streptomyces seoulensis]